MSFRIGQVGLLALSAALVCAVPGVMAGQALPSSEKTREDIVKLADAIEANPMAKGARKQRAKALQLIDDSPDLKLMPCRALLGELLHSKKLGSMELRAHLLIAAARYLADHPAASGSDVEAAVAGLEGVVRAYESMQRQDLRVSIPEVDELAGRYRAGSLASYVADSLANCDK